MKYYYQHKRHGGVMELNQKMEDENWEEITEEQYQNIKNMINQIEQEKENYKFNIMGLFAAGFHKKIGKEHSFYCAEFVKYVIEKADIKTYLPEVVKPEDFKNVEELEVIYTGLLSKYKSLMIKELLKRNIVTYTQREGII